MRRPTVLKGLISRGVPTRATAASQLRLGSDRSQRLVEPLRHMSRSQRGEEALAGADVRLEELVHSVLAEFDSNAVPRAIDMGACTDCGFTAHGDGL